MKITACLFKIAGCYFEFIQTKFSENPVRKTGYAFSDRL